MGPRTTLKSFYQDSMLDILEKKLLLLFSKWYDKTNSRNDIELRITRVPETQRKIMLKKLWLFLIGRDPRVECWRISGSSIINDSHFTHPGWDDSGQYTTFIHMCCECKPNQWVHYLFFCNLDDDGLAHMHFKDSGRRWRGARNWSF